MSTANYHIQEYFIDINYSSIGVNRCATFLARLETNLLLSLLAFVFELTKLFALL